MIAAQEIQKAVAIFVSNSKEGMPSDEQKQTILREFALQRQIAIVSFLAMDGENTSAGIRHALSLCEAEFATCIVCDEPATFALLPEELGEILDTVARRGWSLLFADSGAIFDRKIADSMRTILRMSNWLLNQSRSKKIKSSLMLRKRRGIRLGGKKFGISSSEQTIIKQIQKLHEKGLSLQKICALLSANDIKTTNNKTWHPTTVKRILERTKNKGS